MNEPAPPDKKAPPDAGQHRQARQTGRLPRLNTRMTAVMLEDELIEWGKRQEGGLSATIRRLLRRAMEASLGH